MDMRFEDYLSCAYICFGISTILVFAFSHVRLSSESGAIYITESILPYVCGGCVSGYLIGKKRKPRNVLIIGLRCSVVSSLFNMVFGQFFLGSTLGIHWIYLGVLLGTYSGLIGQLVIGRSTKSPGK